MIRNRGGGNGFDARSNRGIRRTGDHPRTTGSLALLTAAVVDSQRSPCDCSLTYYHSPQSSSYICPRLWIWSPRSRLSAEQRASIFPSPMTFYLGALHYRYSEQKFPPTVHPVQQI